SISRKDRREQMLVRNHPEGTAEMIDSMSALLHILNPCSDNNDDPLYGWTTYSSVYYDYEKWDDSTVVCVSRTTKSPNTYKDNKKFVFVGRVGRLLRGYKDRSYFSYNRERM